MKIKELIDESLNTKLNIEWHPKGRFELGEFIIFERNFRIQIESKPIIHFNIPILKGKKTAEVSFYQYDPETGYPTFDATGEFSGAQAIQILGIVVHALLLKFQEYDAFYFVVKPGPGDMERKTALFYHIASRLAKSQGFFPYEQTVERAPAFLASKIRIPLNQIPKGWANTVQEMLENTDLTKIPRFP